MRMRPTLAVDRDIARAETLPGWVYTDPAVFEAQRDAVFRRSWQVAAAAEAVRTPGSVYPFTLLEGCLDEPLLLTRDLEDRVHALSNVCTHRAGLVCEHPGHERGLRCRYHGRRFALDGRFVSMPEFEAAVGFPTAADHLPQMPLEACGPLLITAIDPAMSAEDLLRPFTTRCGFLPLTAATFDAGRSRDYLVRANWALYCDNYLEGFHIPYVHPSLAGALDYGAYRTELFTWSSLQVGIAGGDEDAFDLPASSPDVGERVAAYYFWLWPNTMLNVYPWGLSVNVVKPLAVDRTRVSYLTFVWDPSRLDRGAGAGLDRVEREDEAIVERVQQGVRSSLYTRGRYSPTRETGVHHFHRLLAAALT
jgi:choline monooxygenase